MAVASAAGGVASAAPANAPDPQELENRINALQAEVEQLKAWQQAARAKAGGGRDRRRRCGRRRAAQSPARPGGVHRRVRRRARLSSPRRRPPVPPPPLSLHPVPQRHQLPPRRPPARSRVIDFPRRRDTQSGFELRRVKFGVDGNAVSPDLTYQAIFSVDRKDRDRHAGRRLGTLPYSRHALGDPRGQIRDPLDHEQIVFAAFSLTADRSLVDDLFAGVDGLVQGVSLGYQDDGPFRAEAAFTDGLRSANTNFQDYPATGADWGVAARVEYKVRGDWKQYKDFTALGDAKPLLVFGAGADYTEAGRTGQLVHVVDAQYENPCGLSSTALPRPLRPPQRRPPRHQRRLDHPGVRRRHLRRHLPRPGRVRHRQPLGAVPALRVHPLRPRGAVGRLGPLGPPRVYRRRQLLLRRPPRQAHHRRHVPAHRLTRRRRRLGRPRHPPRQRATAPRPVPAMALTTIPRPAAPGPPAGSPVTGCSGRPRHSRRRARSASSSGVSSTSIVSVVPARCGKLDMQPTSTASAKAATAPLSGSIVQAGMRHRRARLEFLSQNDCRPLYRLS